MPAAQYFPKHPEYFAMMAGKRVMKNPKTGTPVQPCLTNPDLVQEVVKNAKKWIESRPRLTDTRPIASCLSVGRVEPRIGIRWESYHDYPNRCREWFLSM